jgi:hypothetical protein
MASGGGVGHAQGAYTEEASREQREQYRQRFATGGPVARPGASGPAKSKARAAEAPKPRL